MDHSANDQVAGKSKSMTTRTFSFFGLLSDLPPWKRVAYILYYIAALSFIIWAILDTKRDAIAERDRLDQRIDAIERTLAEIQGTLPAPGRRQQQDHD